MKTTLQTLYADRPLRLFLLATFGITYGAALAMWGLGGLAAAPGWSVPALMFVPTLVALLVTRTVARQPLVASLGLRLQWRGGRWRYLLLALVVPAALLTLTAAASEQLGGSVTSFAVMGARISQGLAGMHLGTGHAGTDLLVLLLLNNVVGVLLNLPLFLGEEIGWRAFLFPRLQRLFGTRAYLLTGVIWGLWHAGLILQGYNYPQHPVAGAVLFLVLCTALSVLFQYFYQRSGSVWGAALAHGSLNKAAATLPFLFPGAAGANDLVYGYVGLVAVLVFGAAALWLMRRQQAASALRQPQYASLSTLATTK